MSNDRTFVLPAPVAILITYRGHCSSNILADTEPDASKRSRSNLSRTLRTSCSQITVSTASRWAGWWRGGGGGPAAAAGGGAAGGRRGEGARGGAGAPAGGA